MNLDNISKDPSIKESLKKLDKNQLISMLESIINTKVSATKDLKKAIFWKGKFAEMVNERDEYIRELKGLPSLKKPDENNP